MIYGVGINDADYDVNPSICGKRVMCPYYRVGSGMIQRCHSKKWYIKQPTYRGCYVNEEWKTFSVFRIWMIQQNWRGKQLDKDYLGDGKLYSSQTCCFIESWLNSLFTDSGQTRGNCPLGVIFEKHIRKYRARLSINGISKNLGLFDCPDVAHKAYWTAKREYVTYKMSNYLDERIKQAVLEKLNAKTSFLIT